MTLRGMTWDHPRAYRPLDAFGGAVWDRQSLEDFEAHPIDDLARRYDLLVIDHPGLGAARASGALLPIDDLVDADTMHSWAADTVGRTWASYTVDGLQWAVPIDAATQVGAYRPDLLPTPPKSWTDVLTAADSHRVTLCLGGPHALLGLLGMCASARDVDGVVDGAPLLDPRAALDAIDLLHRIWRVSGQQTALGNPIAVHEALAASEDLAYCPLVYGYASYAQPAVGAYSLRWTDAPTFGTSRRGSTLGGTGIAVSALSGADLAEVRAFLTRFLDPAVQAGLVPAHSGQPAARTAWDDPGVDAAWGGYYSATRSSIEQAYIRPRDAGWIALQDEGSELVRSAIVTGSGAEQAVQFVNTEHARLCEQRAEAR